MLVSRRATGRTISCPLDSSTIIQVIPIATFVCRIALFWSPAFQPAIAPGKQPLFARQIAATRPQAWRWTWLLADHPGLSCPLLGAFHRGLVFSWFRLVVRAFFELPGHKSVLRAPAVARSVFKVSAPVRAVGTIRDFCVVGAGQSRRSPSKVRVDFGQHGLEFFDGGHGVRR